MMPSSLFLPRALTLGLLVICPLVLSGSQAPPEDQKISGDLGTKTNPVRCDSPGGERQYLDRLRCPDEKPPGYSRTGSYGRGPYGNVIDGFSLRCEGATETSVFMDMYHSGYREQKAVPGFTIVNER
jgi:hypothetical protein